MFLDKFLYNRNHDSDILELHLHFFHCPPPRPQSLFVKVLSYAIAHNVQQLFVDVFSLGTFHNLSRFNSPSIKKLTLNYVESLIYEDRWDLTTLHSFCPWFREVTFPEFNLTCLPCLQTLLLDRFHLPESISLTTLYLAKCNLPPKVWDCPALSTLTLRDVVIPENTTDFFPALVNLQNLTLLFEATAITDCFINCPQLVYLKIKSYFRLTHLGKIMVLAPKLRTFTSVGFFPITFGVSELEYVNIRFPDSHGCDFVAAPLEDNRQYYHQAAKMFRGLGSAKILTLDLNTIEALSVVWDFLARSPPPFYNLKYLKVPQGYKESSMSTYLRCYLLGRSSKATIVTKLPQENMMPHTDKAFVTAQNVILQKPLAAPTKAFAGLKNVHKAVCVDTLNMGVEKEHVTQKSVVNSVTQIGVPVVGEGNDQVSSSKGVSDFGLWRGHEVNSEFVCLLDLILKKYPETFEHFTTINKKFCTMKLNMLCSSVSDFTKISMTQVDTEIITEYRAVFADLQKLGFNVGWLVSRLNYIEQLRFSQNLYPELHAVDCQINDTETKLQDLHTLRTKKMQEIRKAFGTVGTNLIVGCIGDDLLSSP